MPRTGFLPGTLLIPRFVLNELQYIADSPDGLRRQRGRRGMEVLNELQKLPNVLVRISDIDVAGIREVDDKLVVLGKQLKSPVLTNDYNLNRVAELQGVTVLNINELANAVKSVVLPGEVMNINVFQEGKEAGQGVGYMDDGTMVVVENGKEYIGEYMDVHVTKVLQTAAGQDDLRPGGRKQRQVAAARRRRGGQVGAVHQQRRSDPLRGGKADNASHLQHADAQEGRTSRPSSRTSCACTCAA